MAVMQPPLTCPRLFLRVAAALFGHITQIVRCPSACATGLPGACRSPIRCQGHAVQWHVHPSEGTGLAAPVQDAELVTVGKGPSVPILRGAGFSLLREWGGSGNGLNGQDH